VVELYDIIATGR